LLSADDGYLDVQEFGEFFDLAQLLGINLLCSSPRLGGDGNAPSLRPEGRRPSISLKRHLKNSITGI
jgi:hypothetical protein